MEEQELLVHNINALSDSIRRKNRALRSDISERDAFLETTFKPVVEPLKEISQKLTRSDENKENINPLIKNKVDDIMNDSTDAMNSEYEEETSDDVSNLEVEEEEEDEEKHEASESNSDKQNEKEVGGTSQPSSASRISMLSQDIGYKGELTKKYVLKMLHSTLPKRNYHVYGARLTDEGLMIGNSLIRIDNADNLTIKNKTFKGTPGLFELLFTKEPQGYTRKDLESFKTICKVTNAHKKGYDAASPVYRNKSIKYKNLIMKLFPPTKSGRGMDMKNSYNTNVIYYNDVNKLVNRMRLLYEAKEAGHTGVDNEIIALSSELRGRGYIM